MGTTNLNEFIEKFGFKDNNYDVEINSNLEKITKLEKLLTKNKKCFSNLTKKQETNKLELETLEEQFNKLQIELKLKQAGYENNEKSLTEMETLIKSTDYDTKTLQTQNQELNTKKELIYKNKLFEEQQIKEEIRKEILEQQRKDKLKLEVMKEMGISC